jgi:hypothetical protein
MITLDGPEKFFRGMTVSNEDPRYPNAAAEWQGATPAPTDKLPRQKLLDEAYAITSKERNQAYGNPEDNFQNIADSWNAYFKAKYRNVKDVQLWMISPQDVAHLMILMKMARLAGNPNHRDSLVDIAGYAACGEDCRSVQYDGKMEFNKNTIIHTPQSSYDSRGFAIFPNRK